MKRKVTWKCLTLAALLAVSVLAGCAGEKKEPASTNELSLFMLDNYTAFKDDYPVFQELEKQTGVHIKGVLAQSTTDPDSAFNLMMASGNLADIVHTYGRAKFAKYGLEGAFIPLNDLINTHAPNFQKLLDEKPVVRDFITATDGNIYFIPMVPDGEASQGWFIRQDWLDKLGLDAPKTVDEFYSCMVTIKNGDPNGNGQQDEVPYFHRNTAQGINCLYSFWGMNGSLYVADGIVKFSPLESDFRDATKTIAKWYQEGLIDPEIYTRGANSREFMYGNDLGAITHDWFASTADYNEKVQANIPGFQLVCMAPPAGFDGKIREFDKRSAVNEYGFAISSKNAYPEKTMEWIDHLFSEEGRRLMNYGIEGEDYTMVNGKPTFTDAVLHSDLPVAQHLMSRGAQLNMPFHQDFAYEKQWMNKVSLAGMELYIGNQYFTEQLVTPLMDDADQSEYDKIMTDVNTLVSEKMQKWILGSEDIDTTFDAFISDLKKMNVERAVELLNQNIK